MKFLLFIICLAFPIVAPATTFGPIALVEQIEHTQYIVEGLMHAGVVQLEPISKLPHTYYSFSMSDQHKGASLPKVFQIRVPGGEVAGKGYQVAGVPNFTDEEEVILYLKDTNEDLVKEATGLSSGKFSKKPEGENVFLMNGLGYPVTGSEGERMKLYEFLELISRTVNNRNTLVDKSIMLNQGVIPSAGSPRGTSMPNAVAGAPNNPINTDPTIMKDVNLPKAPADKNPMGSSVAHWQIGMRLALLACFTVAIILYFRRMKE